MRMTESFPTTPTSLRERLAAPVTRGQRRLGLAALVGLGLGSAALLVGTEKNLSAIHAGQHERMSALERDVQLLARRLELLSSTVDGARGTR